MGGGSKDPPATHPRGMQPTCYIHLQLLHSARGLDVLMCRLFRVFLMLNFQQRGLPTRFRELAACSGCRVRAPIACCRLGAWWRSLEASAGAPAAGAPAAGAPAAGSLTGRGAGVWLSSCLSGHCRVQPRPRPLCGACPGSRAREDLRQSGAEEGTTGTPRPGWTELGRGTPGWLRGAREQEAHWGTWTPTRLWARPSSLQGPCRQAADVRPGRLGQRRRLTVAVEGSAGNQEGRPGWSWGA